MFIVLQHRNGNGSSWKLGPIPLVIGRSEGCDIRMPDAAMSRRHAKVWIEDDAIRLEDLRSSNSTLVNGVPLERATLKPGDLLAAGSHIFQVSEEAPPGTEHRNGPDSTPITLSVGLTTYTRDPRETLFEAPSRRTVQELHGLFHLGMALGAVETIRDLALLLERTLRDQFDPAVLWLAWRYAGDQPLVFQELDGADRVEEPPPGLLQKALDNREGLIKPGVHRADEKLLGESPAIVRAREILTRAATSNLSVLILGETGTGKEIAARMLHEASPRGGGPYVVVNCAAIPGELFESEFFGHEKGAFTGATQKRLGRFEEAHGGTLFLDEIGDLSPDNQARILRAIETNTFHRVGGQKAIHADVRIVAATNKNLEEPHFRLDLLHRLNSLTIHMPPLRERPEDIPHLAPHFLRLAAGRGLLHVRAIHPDALDHLRQHHWPGNVRELKARIDRAVLFAQGPELGPEDFPIDNETVALLNTAGVNTVEKTNTSELPTLAEVERHYIRHVLRNSKGNISQAARTLGINRVTLYKRMAEYGEG